jgi:hypothetical protein
MKRAGALVKTAAIVGTLLVWFPLAVPLATTDWSSLGTPRFNFDWLMPAELSPVMLLGSLFLLTAALVSHKRRALVGWGLGVAIGSWVLAAVLAQVTGLASGATEPTGLPVIAVLGAFVVYAAAEVELGVAGILLIRDLFSHEAEAAVPPAIPAA